MTLSVSDIQAWDPDDVRQVAGAARARAGAASSVSDGLGALPCLTSWGGRAADAAREAIARTRRDLDAQAREAVAVAAGAARAADRVEAIRGDLARLKVEVAAAGLAIDAGVNRVVAVSGASVAATVRTLLQDRLNALVVQANSVDAELVAAIRENGGPGALSGGARPEVRHVLDQPLPRDPRDFHDLWQQLSADERDLLYSRDPGIGNHPGMPAGSEANPGKDHYNRRHLADELARARATGDAHLADLQAVDRALADNPDTRLMLLDLTGGERAHAAIAVGDPDTAAHVSVTTPGLNTTVRGRIETMTRQAADLRSEALRQLGPGRRDGTVAAIAWIGYDAPQIPGLGDIGGSISGANDVSHDQAAQIGAARLARFYDGIQAARGGTPAHLTAIGHSYGSLTTGLALQMPGYHGVTDAIFYGSPGIGASTPEDLQLRPGHVYAMETPDDPIQWTFDAPPLARALAPVIPGPWDDLLLALAKASCAGEFGPNPATNPNFVRLETGALTVSDGRGLTLPLDGAKGHSDYPRAGSPMGVVGPALPRTTGYNIAAVVAGLGDRAVRGD